MIRAGRPRARADRDTALRMGRPRQWVLDQDAPEEPADRDAVLPMGRADHSAPSVQRCARPARPQRVQPNIFSGGLRSGT